MLVLYKETYKNSYIEYSTEKKMIYSQQCHESQKEGLSHNESKPLRPKKQKKIKKRKNSRNCSSVMQSSQNMHNLQEFVSKNCKDYFSLSKEELSNQFCYTFKSVLHIRSIIGDEDNVYNIKKDENAIIDAQYYLHLIKNRQKGKFSKVLLSKQDTKKTVKYLSIHSKSNRNVLLMDEDEASLLSKRNETQQEMESFLRENWPNVQGKGLDFLTKQILILCRLNSTEESQIVQKIYNCVQSSPDNLYKVHEDTFQSYRQLQDKYFASVIRKNLGKGLQETPIDMLNYFNAIQFQEKNPDDEEPLRLCRTLDSFKCYLKIKKPKIGKSASQSLKTCCAACFSDCYQVMNPIQTCSQCGMRMHKLCQPIRSKCLRCKYIRKTIQEKSNIPYCLVCQRQKQQNIAIEFIYDAQKQYYSHTFCLLTTNSWFVQNKQTHYQRPKPLSVIAQTCSICKVSNNFCSSCQCCSRKMHGLCAFLEGCSMNLSDQGKLEIKCCKVSKQLSLLRKFKMNYQKILYKNSQENQELFRMIQNNQ